MKNACIALVLGLVTVGCQREPAAAPPPPTPAAPHAPAHAKAGSHDDWCAEHEVPESLCTRCNPSLVAAFRATGDWCEEHAVPESQCVTCDPSRKAVRPPEKQGE